ncbi:hypothetical protein SDC9_198669 [bioreactor metagenome]|uniref:Uncharacterized protein n=1 Tax=bioreactor metagenome TaxID=1076179 RepID=A0A645II96_9ZZZZ
MAQCGLIRQIEPQAGAAADRPGGKEGFEDAWGDGRIDTRAVVGDLQPDLIMLMPHPATHCATASGHGLDRVVEHLGNGFGQHFRCRQDGCSALSQLFDDDIARQGRAQTGNALIGERTQITSCRRLGPCRRGAAQGADDALDSHEPDAGLCQECRYILADEVAVRLTTGRLPRIVMRTLCQQ